MSELRGHLLLLLMAGVISTVAFNGCGSDSKGRTGATTDAAEVAIPWGPSVFGYADEASKICRENWSQIRRSFAERYGYKSRGKRFDEAAQNIFLPSLQLVFDNISYLGAPVGDKPRVEEMLIALQLAVFRGQEGTVTSPKQMESLFSEFNPLARQYDLSPCAVVRSYFEV